MGLPAKFYLSFTWDKRVIVWLDYDGRLTNPVLQDISYVASRVISGSMLIVTVNSEGYKSYRNESIKKITKRLRNKFKYDFGFALPPSIEGKHLQGIDMAKTCRHLIEEKIGITLRDRNGLLSEDTQVQYRPLLNFVYQRRRANANCGWHILPNDRREYSCSMPV